MRTLYKFTHLTKDGKMLKLAIRKPTRLELDDADMMFSRFQSECIQKGILTKEMLLKSYKNFGGTLSNQEEKEKVLEFLKQKFETLNIPITSKEEFNKKYQYYTENWKTIV